jgi:hypothetical protein
VRVFATLTHGRRIYPDSHGRVDSVWLANCKIAAVTRKVLHTFRFWTTCCHSLPGVRLRFIYGWVQRDQAGSRARFWMTPSVVWEARSAPAWSRQSICSQEGRFVILLYKLLHTLQRDCSIDGDLWSDFGINRQQIVEKLFWPLAIYLLFTGAR